MKLTNISGHRNIREYITCKLEKYKNEEKSFQTLFRFMFLEQDNIMAEVSDGYRIKKTTYGECQKQILALAPAMANALQSVPQGSIIGLYMANSLQWIQVFWAILACGYKPLLMNTRLSDSLLEDILQEHGVRAVVSDGKTFSAPTLQAQTLFDCAKPNENFTPRFAEEVLFMSSGTSQRVKICAYTSENFFYQICNSVNIVENCPRIASHYEGELKHLALLPFYHVFGFIAVYLWFGFFSRTFVFLKDLKPQTLLTAVQKHKVTHIFAVPLVWEAIRKEALRKIRARGEKTQKKFQKALAFSNATDNFGTEFAKTAFREIRRNLFGESIQFMISGGSAVQSETLAFFNGIGYHLANGYGMTEVGITSVELSDSKKTLNGGTIGRSFSNTEYAVSPTGELLIRGKTMAARIVQDGASRATDYEEWFHSRDLVSKIKNRYYILGRTDDLIVCRNGEKLNAALTEATLKKYGTEELCLFQGENNQAVLLVSVKGIFSETALQSLFRSLTNALTENKLADEIQKIVFTTDALLDESDFKISRKKIAKRYAEGKFATVSPEQFKAREINALSELESEVRACFAQALNAAEEEIAADGHFFLDLGGSSLDYFALTDTLKERYQIDIALADGNSLATVKEICEYITKEREGEEHK